MAEHRNSESWIVRTPPGMKDELTEAAKRAGTDRNKLTVSALRSMLTREALDVEAHAQAEVDRG